MTGRIRFALTIAAGALSACAAVLGLEDGIEREAGAPIAPPDAAPDAARDAVTPEAGPTGCDVSKPFGAPAPLSALNVVAAIDAHVRFTADERIAFFQSNRSGGVGQNDLYTATRLTRADPFGAPTSLAPLNTIFEERDPSPSADGLSLYYTSRGKSLVGEFGIVVATRAKLTDPFGSAVSVAGLKSTGSDFAPYDLGAMVGVLLSSTRGSADGGVSNLFVAAPIDGGFASPTPYDGKTSLSDDRFGAMTADRLTLYFSSSRAGGKGKGDVWVTTRPSTAAQSTWSTPVAVAELNSADDDFPDWVSADRCRLYLTSDRTGDRDVYVATRTP